MGRHARNPEAGPTALNRSVRLNAVEKEAAEALVAFYTNETGIRYTIADAMRRALWTEAVRRKLVKS
jgi:hypothetical protein